MIRRTGLGPPRGPPRILVCFEVWSESKGEGRRRYWTEKARPREIGESGTGRKCGSGGTQKTGMRSGSEFGIVEAEVTSWQPKIVVSRAHILVRPSPSHCRPPCCRAALRASDPARSIWGTRSDASRSSSSDQRRLPSSSVSNSSRLQLRNGGSRSKQSVSSFSTWFKTGGASDYGAPSLFCPPLCRPSVILSSPGTGQQQMQPRNRGNRRISQQKSTISVAAIDGPGTGLNQENLLHEELQRYGVHESDYTCQLVERRDLNSSHGMTEHEPGRGSGNTFREQKTTAHLTNGTKERHTPAKGKSDVVQDWYCYLLLSGDSKKTYVGVTLDIRRRLRQHNGELSGGARSAHAGRPWRLVCAVYGFDSRSEACQFEWRWKSTAAKYKSSVVQQRKAENVESPLVTRRKTTLAKVLKSKEEWAYLTVRWVVDQIFTDES